MLSHLDPGGYFNCLFCAVGPHGLCFSRRDKPMQYYRIYVRLKNGGQATGRELHTGPPPDHSTVLNVPLFSGRTVMARIGPFSTEGIIRRRGSPAGFVTEIYADEI
jgi:hypothetical protein